MATRLGGSLIRACASLPIEEDDEGVGFMLGMVDVVADVVNYEHCVVGQLLMEKPFRFNVF